MNYGCGHVVLRSDVGRDSRSRSMFASVFIVSKASRNNLFNELGVGRKPETARGPFLQTKSFDFLANPLGKQEALFPYYYSANERAADANGGLVQALNGGGTTHAQAGVMALCLDGLHPLISILCFMNWVPITRICSKDAV